MSCFFRLLGQLLKDSEPLAARHCLNQDDILSDPDRLRAMTRGLWNRTAKAELTRVLGAFSPQNTIIHAHQWNKALTVSVFDAVRRGGFQFVLTLHDYFIACPNGAFLVFPKNEICERTPLSASCIACNCDARSFSHKMWRASRHMIQNKIYRLPSFTKHCIYVSAFSQEVLKHHLPQETKWYHVSNPSDFGDVDQVDVADNHSFLFVGRLSAEKGATLFAEAAREAGVQAVFVGDGEEKAAISGVNPDATVTGWLDRDALLRRYREARALVFPSLWYECQPLAILEALSLGLPAIVTDRCAASEAVIDGVNGYRFRRGNVADLVEKIRYLQDDRHAASLSDQAYKIARSSTPGMEEHVRKLIDVYDQVLMRN